MSRPRPRSVAFLRAVNVGGRTVTMAALVEVFDRAGLTGVETFLASGNVVFDTPRIVRAALERRLGAALSKALGYDVPVFVRTLPDVAGLTTYEAFPPAEVAGAGAYTVAFVASPPDRAARARLEALATNVDRFHVHGADIYWLCRVRQSESTFSNAVLERALQQRATIRGLSTLKRLAAKYGA